MLSSKNIDVHVTSFYHSGKFVFLKRSELSRIGVIWVNPSTEKKNPSTISLPWKILFARINRLFHSSLLQGYKNKTTMDTSELYTGAMKDTMHKPQSHCKWLKAFNIYFLCMQTLFPTNPPISNRLLQSNRSSTPEDFALDIETWNIPQYEQTHMTKSRQKISHNSQEIKSQPYLDTVS